jgi:hypothetical protein
LLQARFRRIHQFLCAGQAQIIIGAKIDHLAAVGQLNSGALTSGDNTLVFKKATVTNLLQFFDQMIFYFTVHGYLLNASAISTLYPIALRG